MVMMKEYAFWQFIGFAFTVLGGILLHFLYGWTNKSLFIAPFSAVNESTWERMKLMYFQLFIFALIQSRFLKNHKSFWCVKLVGISTGLILIPVLFYTYNGASGKSSSIVNIAIFILSAAIAFFLETQLFKKDAMRCKYPWLAFGIICLIGVLFVIFTFVTPRFPLFQNPLNGTYGL